jgi:hypothetical protein
VHRSIAHFEKSNDCGNEKDGARVSLPQNVSREVLCQGDCILPLPLERIIVGAMGSKCDKIAGIAWIVLILSFAIVLVVAAARMYLLYGLE